jgi:glycosyltransferase involved in cell wall biosynthesis
MKIALFVPSWPAGRNANGIVAYASYIVPALRKLGHEVYILTFIKNNGDPDPYTINLSRADSDWTFFDRLLLKLFSNRYYHFVQSRKISHALLDLRKHGKVDVCEIEESFGWSLMASRAGDVPVVVRLHGPWIINGQISKRTDRAFHWRVRREGQAISSATLVTAPSKFVLDAVRSHYGLSLPNSRLLFNPIAVGKERWRLADCDQNRILYVGRFDRAKGGDLVLHAFTKLAEKYPKLQLTFVGPDRGIQTNRGQVFKFKDYVAQNVPQIFRERIDFRGELPNSDVMNMRASHLFSIVASRFEILPYSVIEAMALGCPIVASRVGGIPELISDRRNGLLFEKENVEGLANACMTLLENSSYAAEIGAQARQDCELILNPGQMAKETISVYEQAVRGAIG